MNKTVEVQGKTAISTWEMVVYADAVRFRRIEGGEMEESYPPVMTSVAHIYAAAIIGGLQPPRDLRLCDKPIAR